MSPRPVKKPPHDDGPMNLGRGKKVVADWLMPGLRGIAALWRGATPEAPRAEQTGRPYIWEASYPPGLNWDAAIPTGPLFALMDQAVATWPDHRCMEFLGKTYTYREAGTLIDRLAANLAALGVGKDVRVGLFLPNCPYYVLSYFAVLKAGGTVVNFNPLYAQREIARQIADSGATIMVTLNLRTLYPKIAAQLDDTCLQRIIVCSMSGALSLPGKALFAVFKRKELAAIPNDDCHIRFDKLTADNGPPPDIAIDPHKDVALLQYTGGTTGIPKAAMLTHANIYANTMQTLMWATSAKPGEERVLAVLPFFHVFGMTGVMNAAFRNGAELIILPRFKVSEVLRVIHKQRPTGFMGVPTMYSSINAAKDLSKFDLSSLEYCISGGAALHHGIQRQFEELTGCTLVEGYGLTEAAPVCTVNPFDGIRKTGSIGLPVPGTVIEIVALDDPDRLLPVGEKGEICITGPQVMIGYWQHPEDTEQTLRNGRLHTGDVGYMDGDGFVYIIDRIKELIISAGFNVYPRMVEEAVLLHEAVAEAVVCGIPDKHRGEVVKAYIVLKPGTELKPAELRQFLRDKLAPFEQPRRIEIREELPLTLIGKPSRRELVMQELKRAEAAGPEAEPSLETTQ